ncbi:DNAJ-domain protein, putative [Leishmania donovani]|uniref:DNAJ-domain protein, putative n=1 Tax=Leishmania donovani TaxID=5661 RepID=E9BGZ6_LEIDO|nr:DNAJ-domain protein, putative [Leishmania donovani]CBZ34522.1 DNAJ-domain protein, putative [Leishmania donovani]
MLRRSHPWRVMTPRQALRVLSLSPTADLTPASIKKAYIRQTLQCHPDLHPNNPNANENFRNLSDAFRVALKALEAQRGGGSAAGRRSTTSGAVDLYDPQEALESLRQAMIAYHRHQQSSEAPSTPSSSSPPYGKPESHAAGAFFTPTLEDVSSVCQREAVAMRRVHTFCAELPAVLCGSHSAALFEAVAFFHTRYVESMSACVMRFAQNLPIIVRRVVKQRRRYVDNGYLAVAQGIGTGSRPRGQRIEDMAMKPLVLMGALIFDLPEGASNERRQCLGEDAVASGGGSSSTCGASRPADVRVSDELKCIIYPADSIADITAKLGRWEAASFDRLKLELAIVDVNRLMSAMLGLQDEESSGRSEAHLSVEPHLSESSAAAAMVLRTLQKLAGDLCCHFDAAVDSGAVTEAMVEAMRLQDSCDTSASVQDDIAAQSLETPALVAQCRQLAELACPTIRGNIVLTWKAVATDELVKDDAEQADVTTAPMPLVDASQTDSAGKEKGGGKVTPPFLVGRHLTCSTAETLFFSVSVTLTRDLHAFLLRLRGALKRVVQSTNQSKRTLFELLPLRESIVKEEFTRIASDDDADTSPFRYRGPVNCFPRICNMDTHREHQLWKHLYVHREYVAKHAPAMNPLNVFYECFPYDPDAPAHRPSSLDADGNVLAGWVSGGPDGCDNVVITATQLDDPAHFTEWLEEVVEQSSLNRETEEILAKAGVGYVSRDPVLPLANYLSFVKAFAQSTAVRAVLERKDGAPHKGTATPDDIGLAIIVSPSRCDVRDGGRLFIPWYVDPAILLALLDDADTSQRLDV